MKLDIEHMKEKFISLQVIDDNTRISSWPNTSKREIYINFIGDLYEPQSCTDIFYDYH